MDDVANTLSEIRDNNQQILIRCNKLCEPTCQCEALLEQTRKDLHCLRLRVHALENICKKKGDEVKNLSDTIQSLKHQQETIQRNLQTDDAQLRYRSPSPADEQAVCAHEERKTKSVTFDNATEFDTSDEDNWFCTKFARTEEDTTSPGQDGATITTESEIVSKTNARTTRVEAKEDECSASPTVQVGIIKQVTQRIFLPEMHWSHIAQDEFNESKPLFHELDGYHTILCLDISESMLEDNGWEQASTFVRGFLNGLSEMSNINGITNEYVVLVTFGHETVVKQRFSNDYEKILHMFNGLKLGGPSTLYGGLLLSHAAMSSSRWVGTRLAEDLILTQRIVIITDGRPTDVNVIAGPDTITSNSEQTKRYIVDQLCHPEIAQYDICVVPVGNVDTEFIDAMIGVSGGMHIDYTQGRRFSRRRYLSTIASEYGGNLLLVRLSLFSLREPLTAEEQEDITSIIDRSKRCSEMMGLPTGPPIDYYHEKPRSQLPPIGSRVRRGPDWKRNQEDGSGAGTAIGHAKDTDELWIEWDKTDLIKKYRYGDTGYDILIVDEPRESEDGRLLAVGCSVKPGKAWKKAEPKPKRGVVIKIDTASATATVRWDNARRGDFSAELEKGELDYCPTLERHSEDSDLSEPRRETAPNMHTYKTNKNSPN